MSEETNLNLRQLRDAYTNKVGEADKWGVAERNSEQREERRKEEG